MSLPCTDPLVDRFFSILGRLGVFTLLLESGRELTLNQLIVLFHLYYHGERIMRQIAQKLQVSDPAATAIVDNLVDRGLVERLRDPNDRRRVRVRLTDRGRREVGGIRHSGAQSAAAVFDRLDPAQRDALLSALEPVDLLLAAPVEPGDPDRGDAG